VAPIPTFPGRPTASSAGSWWLGIPRGARHPEAAWAFLRFATQRQTQLEEAEDSGGDLFPANRLAATPTAADAGSSGVQAAGGGVQAGADGICDPEKQEAAQLGGDQVGGAQQLQRRLRCTHRIPPHPTPPARPPSASWGPTPAATSAQATECFSTVARMR
jgi:ABC-type glycerol-3-phosphate transport system substrate-binding protein